MFRSDAGRWRRIGAMVIDWLVVCLPTTAVCYAAWPFIGQIAARLTGVTLNRAVRSVIRTGDLAAAGESLQSSAVLVGRIVSAVMISGILSMLVTFMFYTWIAHAVFGRTVGKALFGIAVVRNGDGNQAGAVRCLVRSLVLFGPPIVLVAGALAAVITGQDENGTFLQVLRWVTLSGLFLVLLPQRRGLHDWLSGTGVSRV